MSLYGCSTNRCISRRAGPATLREPGNLNGVSQCANRVGSASTGTSAWRPAHFLEIDMQTATLLRNYPAGDRSGWVSLWTTRGLSRSREPGRLHELDSLRPAAIGVVGWHYASHFGAAPLPSLMAPFYHHGELLVDFFFVLSGFVAGPRVFELDQSA